VHTIAGFRKRMSAPGLGCAAETTHERGYLRADRKLAAGTGFYEAHALDAADGSRLRLLASAHVHLSVIHTECFYLDDDVSRLRLRLRELLDDKTIEAAKLFENSCAHQTTPWKGLLEGRTAYGFSLGKHQKITDHCRDFVAVRLERKVTGVEETHLRARNVALERLRARRQEEGVVFAPNCQERWLVFAEICLKFRVHGDVVLIVAKEIELDFIRAGARQIEVIKRISVWRN
jgi:hypothetical protein